MKKWQIGMLAAAAVTVVAAASPAGPAQHDHHRRPPAAPHEPAAAGGSRPLEMGQAAFAAISEIVASLEADPGTDWARVDVGALRAHLVDMERLTVDAEVRERPVERGLEIVVGGSAAAVEAARRMVPAHAAMVAGARGWAVETEDRGTDLRVLWTTGDPAEVPKLRALGFFGLMATGDHHPHHHRMIATGRNPH